MPPTECSWDMLRIRHQSGQDKAATEDELMNVQTEHTHSAVSELKLLFAGIVALWYVLDPLQKRSHVCN